MLVSLKFRILCSLYALTMIEFLLLDPDCPWSPVIPSQYLLYTQDSEEQQRLRKNILAIDNAGTHLLYMAPQP